MQTIETIGPDVSHLTVFQRIPNLANPRRQQHLTPEQSVAERTSYPERYVSMSQTPTGLEVKPINHDTFDDDTATRRSVYEDLWEKGAQHFWFGNYRDLLTSKAANREAYEFWRSKTSPRIHDPVKRDLLCPSTPPHAFGAKRPSLEETYFEVFNQSNVDLVDLRNDAIAQVASDGIKMVSGAFHKLDIICLATGYDFAIGSQVSSRPKFCNICNDFDGLPTPAHAVAVDKRVNRSQQLANINLLTRTLGCNSYLRPRWHHTQRQVARP